MPSYSSPRPGRRSARRPPHRPLEKKWRSYLNAHSLAFGSMIETVPNVKRAEVQDQLHKLARSRGARDYLNGTKSKNATTYVRMVLHLFSNKRELAEQYLTNFAQGFR